MTTPVRDSAERGRSEVEIDGRIAFARYRRTGSTLAILHVEAPLPLRGTGAAGRLMEGIMEIARATGAKIVPLCSYASAWLRRHREYGGVFAWRPAPLRGGGVAGPGEERHARDR